MNLEPGWLDHRVYLSEQESKKWSSWMKRAAGIDVDESESSKSEGRLMDDAKESQSETPDEDAEGDEASSLNLGTERHTKGDNDTVPLATDPEHVVVS